MARAIVQTLRSMRIGSRITLMTCINVLFAALLLGLAWWALQQVQQRLHEMERLRDQSIRVEAIGKKGLQLMLIARQFIEEGDQTAVSRLAVYGTELERVIMAEAAQDPAIASQTEVLLENLAAFQDGFDQLLVLKNILSDEYEYLLELGENIASFIAIVNANARGDSAYDLLPELEKANRWLHQAVAGVNRFYFADEEYENSLNSLVTLSIYLPALADRAGNSLRTSYLNQAAELVEKYMAGLERLAEFKVRERELSTKGLNEPQAKIQASITNIVNLNATREQAGAEAFRKGLERMSLLGLSLVGGLLLLSGLLSWAIGRSITTPLAALHHAVRDQAEGRPVRRIPEGGDDELTAMAGTLHRVISLQEEKDSLIQELQRAQKAVNLALTRIRTLLDNSGQGVVSFGADLLVEPEFSRECCNIFQRESIVGMRVDALLCPHEAPEGETRDLLATNFRRICQQADPFRRDMLISLMPQEFVIGDKTVEVQYRPLADPENGAADRLMLLLTDVSEARALQRTVQAEGRRLSLVVAAVKNRDELLDVLDDFHDFLQDASAPAADAAAPLETGRALRLLHTYKGLFGLMECIHLPQALHEAEARLTSLPLDHDAEAMQRALGKQELLQAAEQDMDLIRQALGDSFLESRGEVVLPPDKTAKLLELADVLARRCSGPDFRDIAHGLELLRRLRHVDLRQLLERYPRMAVQIAERQDKELAPFSVTGDEALVDPERFAPFVRSLVHVFRNAVDHGLEPREEREAAGKPAAGSMACELRRRHDGGLELEINDDGRGLDIEALQQQAREQGLAFTPERPEELIFAQGLSTSDHSGVESADVEQELSGRGVGLAAVRAELERLGGTVRVTSKAGAGTRFVFTFRTA